MRYRVADKPFACLLPQNTALIFLVPAWVFYNIIVARPLRPYRVHTSFSIDVLDTSIGFLWHHRCVAITLSAKHWASSFFNSALLPVFKPFNPKVHLCVHGRLRGPDAGRTRRRKSRSVFIETEKKHCSQNNQFIGTALGIFSFHFKVPGS